MHVNRGCFFKIQGDKVYVNRLSGCLDNPEKNTSTTCSSLTTFDSSITSDSSTTSSPSSASTPSASTTSRRYVRQLWLVALGGSSSRTCANYRQRSRAWHQLAPECGNQLRRHQQRDDPNNARGLDNNFASDRGCDSTTSTRLRHHRLRRADHAALDKS
jgi:hypothetical protein